MSEYWHTPFNNTFPLDEAATELKRVIHPALPLVTALIANQDPDVLHEHVVTAEDQFLSATHHTTNEYRQSLEEQLSNPTLHATQRLRWLVGQCKTEANNLERLTEQHTLGQTVERSITTLSRGRRWASRLAGAALLGAAGVGIVASHGGEPALHRAAESARAFTNIETVRVENFDNGFGAIGATMIAGFLGGWAFGGMQRRQFAHRAADRKLGRMAERHDRSVAKQAASKADHTAQGF